MAWHVGNDNGFGVLRRQRRQQAACCQDLCFRLFRTHRFFPAARGLIAFLGLVLLLIFAIGLHIFGHVVAAVIHVLRRRRGVQLEVGMLERFAAK